METGEDGNACAGHAKRRNARRSAGHPQRSQGQGDYQATRTGYSLLTRWVWCPRDTSCGRSGDPQHAESAAEGEAAIMRLLLILFICATASPALAGPYEEANAAYDGGDYATAVHIYRSLAENGEARAQNNLCVMYSYGMGVLQDYEAAMLWCRKAADQGAASSQYNLGRMYYDVSGMPKDFVQAYKWFNLAAASADKTTQRDVAMKYRNLVAAQMTAAQVAEAQKLAREWKPSGVSRSVGKP
jgi:TPR repeat protein